MYNFVFIFCNQMTFVSVELIKNGDDDDNDNDDDDDDDDDDGKEDYF